MVIEYPPPVGVEDRLSAKEAFPSAPPVQPRRKVPPSCVVPPSPDVDLPTGVAGMTMAKYRPAIPLQARSKNASFCVVDKACILSEKAFSCDVSTVMPICQANLTGFLDGW